MFADANSGRSDLLNFASKYSDLSFVISADTEIDIISGATKMDIKKTKDQKKLLPHAQF